MVSARSIPIEHPTSFTSEDHKKISEQGKYIHCDKNDTSVTLSFGGVNFCLTPSVVAPLNMEKLRYEEQQLFSIAKKANGIQINMSNFSGTLFVFSNNEERMQHSIKEDVDREKSMKSDTFRFSQKSITSRYTSATPSPPDSPHEKSLQRMVDAMPAMIVPMNSRNLTSVTQNKVKNDIKSKIKNKQICNTAFQQYTRDYSNPVVTPSTTKKRERNITDSISINPSLNKLQKPKTQVSVFDMISGKKSKKTKMIEMKKDDFVTAKNTSTPNVPTSNRVSIESFIQPNTPTLGQSDSQSSVEGSENLLSFPVSVKHHKQIKKNDSVDENSKNSNSDNVKLSLKVRELVKDVSDLNDQESVSLSSQVLGEFENTAMSQSKQNSSIVEMTMDTERKETEKIQDTTLNKTKASSDSPSTKQLNIYPRIPNIQNPPPRWGHTLTPLSDDRIALYGGQSLTLGTLNDLYIYCLKTRKWTKPINCTGLPRCWHSSTYIPSRQLLISFGGESINPKSGKAVTTDQIMVLDTDIMLWYPPVCSGIKPTARSGHTACLLPTTNSLVIFGGTRKGKWLNTILCLDTNRWKWSSPKIKGEPPRPRSYHTSTPISGNRIVIFGGNDGKQCFNNLYVLDANGAEEEWNWIYPQVSGQGPSPRTGHIATLLEDGKNILIHGGWDPNEDDDVDTIFEDSFILDTTEWVWSKGPQRKYGGGGPEKGPKRVGHCSVLVEGQGSKDVLSFGGRTMNAEFGNDFQVFHVDKNEIGP